MSLGPARINAFVENYISNEKEVPRFIVQRKALEKGHEIDSKIDLHKFEADCIYISSLHPI